MTPVILVNGSRFAEPGPYSHARVLELAADVAAMPLDRAAPIRWSADGGLAGALEPGGSVPGHDGLSFEVNYEE